MWPPHLLITGLLAFGATAGPVTGQGSEQGRDQGLHSSIFSAIGNLFAGGTPPNPEGWTKIKMSQGIHFFSFSGIFGKPGVARTAMGKAYWLSSRKRYMKIDGAQTYTASTSSGPFYLHQMDANDAGICSSEKMKEGDIAVDFIGKVDSPRSAPVEFIHVMSAETAGSQSAAAEARENRRKGLAEIQEKWVRQYKNDWRIPLAIQVQVAMNEEDLRALDRPDNNSPPAAITLDFVNQLREDIFQHNIFSVGDPWSLRVAVWGVPVGSRVVLDTVDAGRKKDSQLAILYVNGDNLNEWTLLEAGEIHPSHFDIPFE